MPRSTKNLALQKIESHEKLCRIMQKQTHEKIEKLETSIERRLQRMDIAIIVPTIINPGS